MHHRSLVAGLMLVAVACLAFPTARRVFRSRVGSASSESTRRRSMQFTTRCATDRSRCRALVQAYLRRIDAYDKQGPAINAITVVNPDALATADSLDKRFAATRAVRRSASLHSDDREGQLRDDRLANGRRQFGAQGLYAEQGCVSDQAHQGRRRDRAGQIQHGGIRVQSGRDGQLGAAGLHAQSLRARPGHRRLVGRDGRRRRRRPRRGWSWN